VSKIGKKIYSLAEKLFPITRSITGSGVRKTLDIIKRELPNLIINEVSTGEKCFDWKVPKEWNIKNAYIVTPDGKKICDLSGNNLHVVSYSIPVDKKISLNELQKHLHSLPKMPSAIPYITSYYEESWGFCIADEDRKLLKEGDYHVFIDSTLSDGSLTYGELLVKGKMKSEIFLSTYVCHPSMGNNEVSGPAVTTYLAKWIESLENRRYSYRIIFIPETIGAICYLSKNLDIMKKNIIAGLVVTCIGDDRSYSFLPSKYGDTYSDRVALFTLENYQPSFNKYSFLDRGSDERQYCSVGVDLPVCSIMRTKYWEYPEYHTSLDDMNLISVDGLYGGYDILKKTIEIIETNKTYVATTVCEPQLGKRGLYDNGKHASNIQDRVRKILNFLAYADGNTNLIDLSIITKIDYFELVSLADLLIEKELLETCSER
jgi:aminopeptidase-like protein